ncbi:MULTISPECIES: CinA family protein [unclassified Actinotalea]|uniref:CinA family protein n=1 Tax=unclassified Actinotalea TaxID=2638618 RepID=UPI001C7156CB|nr:MULTISPECIES: nicotinamide-nucleotide amidohydrolase family protein [unclassified Actinotalea]
MSLPGAAAVELLARAGWTVAVAESLTGGALCAALVDVPGASRCVRGGVVAYATDLKAALLGVDGQLLAEHGAVHPEVALQMARGVRVRLGATWGLATTGVAGPDPHDGHAPGTFHVAVDGPGGPEVVSVEGSGGDRAAVREAASLAALRLLIRRAGDGGGHDPMTTART